MPLSLVQSLSRAHRHTYSAPCVLKMAAWHVYETPATTFSSYVLSRSVVMCVMRLYWCMYDDDDITQCASSSSPRHNRILWTSLQSRTRRALIKLCVRSTVLRSIYIFFSFVRQNETVEQQQQTVYYLRITRQNQNEKEKRRETTKPNEYFFFFLTKFIVFNSVAFLNNKEKKFLIETTCELHMNIALTLIKHTTNGKKYRDRKNKIKC